VSQYSTPNTQKNLVIPVNPVLQDAVKNHEEYLTPAYEKLSTASSIPSVPIVKLFQESIILAN